MRSTILKLVDIWPRRVTPRPPAGDDPARLAGRKPPPPPPPQPPPPPAVPFPPRSSDAVVRFLGHGGHSAARAGPGAPPAPFRRAVPGREVAASAAAATFAAGPVRGAPAVDVSPAGARRLNLPLSPPAAPPSCASLPGPMLPRLHAAAETHARACALPAPRHSTAASEAACAFGPAAAHSLSHAAANRAAPPGRFDAKGAARTDLPPPCAPKSRKIWLHAYNARQGMTGGVGRSRWWRLASRLSKTWRGMCHAQHSRGSAPFCSWSTAAASQACVGTVPALCWRRCRLVAPPSARAPLAAATAARSTRAQRHSHRDARHWPFASGPRRLQTRHRRHGRPDAVRHSPVIGSRVLVGLLLISRGG